MKYRKQKSTEPASVTSRNSNWEKRGRESLTEGSLHFRSDRVKLNHIYMWASAPIESLIKARLNEDPELMITYDTNSLD